MLYTSARVLFLRFQLKTFFKHSMPQYGLTQKCLYAFHFLDSLNEQRKLTIQCHSNSKKVKN